MIDRDEIEKVLELDCRGTKISKIQDDELMTESFNQWQAEMWNLFRCDAPIMAKMLMEIHDLIDEYKDHQSLPADAIKRILGR